MLLHYPYEVRQASEYFDEIQDGKITSATLSKHIVEPKSGHFDPSQFEDHYEAALQDLGKENRSSFRSPSEIAASQKFRPSCR